VALLVAGLALVALWIGRAPVTDFAVRRYLAANGIDAAFETVAAGRHRLMLDRVRLGSKNAPDLTARRIVIDIDWFAMRPAVAGVRLDGAVLTMRADANGVSFGSLDRVIPPGRSTRFPALRLDAADAAVALLTPAGRIDARIDAAGRLDRDFRAVARTAPFTLRTADCGATARAADFILTTAARDFTVTGHGRLVAAACRRATTPSVDWKVTIAAPLALTRLRGKVRLTSPEASIAGSALLGIAFDAQLEGPPAALQGRWSASLGKLARGPDRAGPASATGTLAFTEGRAMRAGATVAVRDIRPGSLIALLPAGARLPTLANKLIDRVRNTLQQIDLTAQVDFGIDGGPHVHVINVEAAGAAGAKLRLTGGIEWTKNAMTFASRVSVRGGKLPDINIDGAGTADGGHGGVTIGPWHDGGDTLELTGGRFDWTAGRATAGSRLRLSSAFAGGRVDGLTVPLTVSLDRRSGSLAIGTGCVRASVDSARIATMQLSATSATLCPGGSGPLATLNHGRIRSGVHVAGLNLGGVADGLVFSATSGPFALRVVGTAAAPEVVVPSIDLAVASDPWRGTARFGVRAVLTRRGWIAAGTVSAWRAAGPSVIATEGRTHWQLASGTLALDAASVTLADPRPLPSFNPLHVVGASGRLVKKSLIGRGSVSLPDGRVLAQMVGTYDLASGAGSADVSSALTFSPTLQPIDISERARGLVANVSGTVTTTARLLIAGTKLTGTGTVRLAEVGLATAALGPVTGISGTIAFDDLPALHTAAHQEVHIAGLDPGVAVDDVTVRFQLLGRDAVAIERLAWPFTGGTMTVRPTVLRAGTAARKFAIDVAGLDAEQFLQRFQIKNLNTTGKFDGVLPLIFEGATGRIVGGALEARAGGGLIQYIGEVGQASMGAAGRLAFDALRRLRYRTLTLRLDGDLDAEIVTTIDFTGSNEAPLTAGSPLPMRATGLPFKFGVTVRAPFRALLGTAASFSDARAVIRAAKPVE